MKKLSIILLLFVTGFSQAQVLEGKMFSFGANIYTGYNHQLSVYGFSKMYNHYFSDQLKRKLGDFSLARGAAGQITFMNNSFIIELETDHQLYRTKAVFKDKTMPVRYMEMWKMQNLMFFGGAFTVGEQDDYITVGSFIGMTHAFLGSYRKYPTGDISYGNESETNGKYRQGRRVLGALSFGVKTEYNKAINSRLTAYAVFKTSFDMAQPAKPLGSDNGQITMPASDDVQRGIINYNFTIGIGIRFNAVNSAY